MFISHDSSLDEHVFVLFFFERSEKSLFSFLKEVYSFDEKVFMSVLEISLEVLFDLHIEYITRKRYLTETKIKGKKENLIAMLDDSRWKSFDYSFDKKRDGVEVCFNNNCFKLLGQILILGGYKNYTKTLLSAMRVMYILSVQSAKHRPVNTFYKTYKTQVSAHKENINFYFEDLTKEIKGMVTFH